MTPFKPITKPVEVDFYEIFKVAGVKLIHIFGYSYPSSNYDYVSENNPDGTYWASTECVGIVKPLTDFVSQLTENEDYVNDLFDGSKQYQGDLTAEEMVRAINSYFNGHGADAYLDYAEITEDTPCGNYITKPLYGEIEL